MSLAHYRAVCEPFPAFCHRAGHGIWIQAIEQTISTIVTKKPPLFSDPGKQGGNSYIHLLANKSGSEIRGKQGGILTLGGILSYNCTDRQRGANSADERYQEHNDHRRK